MIRPSDTMRAEAHYFWKAAREMRHCIRHGIPFNRNDVAEEFDALGGISDWPLIKSRYFEARREVLRLSLAFQA